MTSRWQLLLTALAYAFLMEVPRAKPQETGARYHAIQSGGARMNSPDSAATNAARALLLAMKAIAQVAKPNEPIVQATFAIERSGITGGTTDSGSLSKWPAAVEALAGSSKPLACVANLENRILAIQCRPMTSAEQRNWQVRAQTVLPRHLANLRRILGTREANPAILFRVAKDSVSLTLPEYEVWSRDYEIALDYSMRLTPATVSSSHQHPILVAEFGPGEGIQVIKRPS